MLKIGYTTGTHTAAMVKSALYKWLKDEYLNTSSVTLPTGDIAEIRIDEIHLKDKVVHTSTVKTHNDDFDVTKGCKMICLLSDEKDIITPALSTIEHQPHKISIGNSFVYFYAGKGVGVATKKGLKVDIGFPAINPVPMKMLSQVCEELLGDDPKEHHIHCVVQFEDGETIAKQTANEKVGVIGGLSVLGTKGIVKPISASAYIDSIASEISVANENGVDKLIFTLGNSSLDFSKDYFKLGEMSYIEIGNFIYDSLKLLIGKSFTELCFVANLGKMTKVAQGFENTHNKCGWIRFEEVIPWLTDIYPELKGELQGKSFTTTKEFEQTLLEINSSRVYSEKLYEVATQKALESYCKWIADLKSEGVISLKKVQTLTTNGKKILAFHSIDL